MYKKIYKSLNIMAIITLLLTTSFILTTSYIIQKDKIKEELKAECILLKDILESKSSDENIISTLSPSDKRRITLISQEGIIIDDTYENPEINKNISSYTEITGAKNTGEGYIRRYSEKANSMVTYYSLLLSDGRILRVGSIDNNFIGSLLGITLPIIAVALLIYLLCKFIASGITKSIIRPINDINLTKENYDDIYPELVPFVKRISGQSKEIVLQAERVNRQKARLQTVSENMTEGFVLLDKEKNISSINKGASKIFGIEDVSAFPQKITAITSNSDIISVTNNAFNGKKSSKSVKINNVYYKVFANPVYEKEAIIGVVMLIVDTNEETKSEIIRREFSANVSHELKTPMTTILGYSQLINSGIAKNEDIRQFTEKIEKESSRLINLIEDIIKLSRLDESGQIENNKEEISLEEVINEVTENLTSKANERNIKISIKHNTAVINGFKGQIIELIYNLLDNAIKYNKDNGEVFVSYSDKELIISDTGIGIPESDLSRIFERFFRVDKSRSKKVNGTGLGLSIVKHICMQNNFEINVESQLNKGTTFKIQF